MSRRFDSPVGAMRASDEGEFVEYGAYAKLEEACMNLYYAGYWSCDRECDEVGLWTALKNALGLKDGTSPKASEVLGND